MKNLLNIKVLMAGLMITTCFYACKKDMGSANNNLKVNQTSLVAKAVTVEVTQTNLVADTAGFDATRIDANLVNAWGIAAVPNGGPIWISANHTGVSVIYDKAGNTLRPPVTIPSIAPGQVGAPTGVIFNSTPDFGGNKFIFASEDGIVLAWKPGSNSAIKVADRTRVNAVYKGIAMVTDGNNNFLCLTNFFGSEIDVFDKNFNFVTDHRFVDPTIPAGFAPFNIQTIEGKVYITYAKQKPDKHDDQSGPGFGYVDVFNPNGTLVKRFASQGTLNSPWGMALAAAGFAGDRPTILISNFGDGTINIFSLDGGFKGQVKSGGETLSIEGLWAIDFLNGNMPGGSPSDPLYFTAGPFGEAHGLFGYLKKQ
jgi:uncharacterized protein (TIGR03118 family)